MARRCLLAICVVFLATAVVDVACSCGGAIQGAGVVQSPNYPSSYSVSTNCTWTLQASPPLGSIFLQFKAFSTQQCCDFLYINDTDGTTYTFSGSALPANLTLARQATITFTSDASVVSTGFSINVTTIVIPCGGTINGAGVILSPNYPNNYPSYSNCTWTLQASPINGSLFLQFISFATQDNYDVLSISDNDGMTYLLSGATLPFNTTLAGQATVKFTSDDAKVFSGFSITVNTIVTPCGGIINGSGTILSPNYPNKYPRYSNCTWTLQASSADGRIFLQFNSFATEEDQDFLNISDSSGSSASFSGAVLPPSMTLAKQATIRFTSDDSGVFPGFSISVKTIGCSDRSSGAFSPPALINVLTASYAPSAVISSVAERSSIECGATCLHCDFCVAFTYDPTSRGCALLSTLPWSLSSGPVQLYVRL